jgi:ABC-type transport system involved in cytochrome bd biosynthesis fused ATPase/permease subunit
VTAIYVIAAVLVVLFLVGAYRTMGAGASTGEAPKAVLVAVLATTDEAFAALDAEAETDSDAARAVRRRLDGCSQALDRIAATPIDESLDHARAALELAVDELSWSARLRETPGYTRDPGLREAVAGLRGHASANLAHAHAVLDA